MLHDRQHWKWSFTWKLRPAASLCYLDGAEFPSLGPTFLFCWLVLPSSQHATKTPWTKGRRCLGQGIGSMLVDLFWFCSFFPFFREKAFLSLRKVIPWCSLGTEKSRAHHPEMGSPSKCDSQTSITGITPSLLEKWFHRPYLSHCIRISGDGVLELCYSKCSRWPSYNNKAQEPLLCIVPDRLASLPQDVWDMGG